MSGWDKPSRPTWDPQDGPEDGTQAFPAPDGSGADDRWSQPVDAGWGGTGAVDGRDFGRPDFGASDFGGGSSASGNGFSHGQNGFPGEMNGGFAGEQGGFPGEPNGFPRGGASAPPSSDFFPQEFEQRQPGATLAGRQLPSRGNYVSGPQASARDEPPWPGPARQESARQESARPDYGRSGDYGRIGNGRADDGRADDGRASDFGRADDFGRVAEYGRTGEYGRQESARADFGRPGAAGAPGQDLPRRDSGRAEFSAYSTYSGQADQAEQATPRANRGDAELAARMDPALQDFFAPTKPDPRYTSVRPNQAAQPPGLPGPGQLGPGQLGPGQPGPGGPGRSEQAEQPSRRGDGRGPQRRPRRADDPWEDPADGPSGSRDGRLSAWRDDDDDDEPSGKGKLLGAIGGVVLVLAAAGIAYLALHGSGSSNNNAAGGGTPTTTASAPTAPAKPNATGSAKSPNVAASAAAAGAYLLSTPSTAAGYPIGSDPKFLATATSTVAAFEQSAIKSGGGTVTGSPVSASYTLPDAQTIEFVGYQGTFNPATVMANLKDYGSSETSYPAGPNHGDLACANTTATATTPSGAVCVWVTNSTLGFTEFFTQANGPESLNAAQIKGAQDTVDLRASVEKLKS